MPDMTDQGDVPQQQTLTIKQALELATQHHGAGDLSRAEALYQQVLQIEPGHPVALHLLGVVAHQVGKNDTAVELISKALAITPQYADAHSNLGLAYQGLGQLEQAVASYRQAIAINAEFVMAHNNLGNALQSMGRLDEAVASYRQALAINPDFAQAHNNLGNVFKSMGKLDQAVASLGKAIAIKADFAEAHSNLGMALQELGRLDQAVASFKQTLSLKPDFAQAHNNLGNAYKKMANFDEAVASFNAALAINPQFIEAHNNLGRALQEMGRIDDALACFERAISIDPAYAQAHNNLGLAFQYMGRLDQAEASYRQALSLNPEFIQAHNNLGFMLQQQGQLDQAVESFNKALAIDPDFAQAHNNLGITFTKLGKMDDAVACYHQAIAIDPDFTLAHSNLAISVPFVSNISATDIFAQTKKAGAVFEAPFTDQLKRRHANDPDPERPLKVGYLSPNLSDHVLASYLEPVFKAHRRERVSVHVYANVPRPDDTTQRLKQLADSWTFVNAMSDDQVAARIIDDGIDILVDPMGHWAGNRLLVFARKPAPLQVSYLCQGMTTGLSGMDYAIGDRWLNEGGVMQALSSEQTVELASGFQVTHMGQHTPIGPLPARANGFITFCSFNNPAKISDVSLALWAGVLASLPASRLLIKGKWLEHAEKRRLLIKHLDQHGIGESRVELRGFVEGPDHLVVHNETDIALDTAPFTGGATSVDALWMGVPVITLIGDTISGRYSYSHLGRIGCPELAAHSQDEFHDIAVALAGDLDRLGNYRQTLRSALSASSLFNGPQHVGELEDAFRVMWRRWCEGLAPEGFTINAR